MILSNCCYHFLSKFLFFSAFYYFSIGLFENFIATSYISYHIHNQPHSCLPNPHLIHTATINLCRRNKIIFMTMFSINPIQTGGGGGGAFDATRLWRIVLLKVAYYATSSARNFAKLSQNYARIPKLYF